MPRAWSLLYNFSWQGIFPLSCGFLILAHPPRLFGDLALVAQSRLAGEHSKRQGSFEKINSWSCWDYYPTFVGTISLQELVRFSARGKRMSKPFAVTFYPPRTDNENLAIFNLLQRDFLSTGNKKPPEVGRVMTENKTSGGGERSLIKFIRPSNFRVTCGVVAVA